MSLVGKVAIITHSFMRDHYELGLIESETAKTVMFKSWYVNSGQWGETASRRDKAGVWIVLGDVTAFDMPDLSARLNTLKDERKAAEQAARLAFMAGLEGLKNAG